MTTMLLARIERRRAPLALGVLLLAAGCRMPETLSSGLFTQTERRPIPTAEDCERCHQAVVREWRSSPHAHAFESEAFQRASAGGRAEACVGCHAPSPIRGGERPRVRDVHRAEGVTCLACHGSPDLDAAPLTMRGPISRTSPIEIHPIVEADPLYQSSELCGTCHEGALSEWQAAEPPPGEATPPTCQGCHMPGVRRKMESVHDEHTYSALFVALGDERELRRHTFDVPEAQSDQIGLEATLEAASGALRVRVENHLPHGLPTGTFGRRELRLRARWPGGEATRARSRRLDGPLASGEAWEIRVELPEGTPRDAIEVDLDRWDASSAGWRRLRRAAPAVDAS